MQDSGKRLPGRGSEVGDHEVARSCAIAEHAEQWHVVQRFRAECLPSGVLVSTEEVRAWMAQRHGDGPVEWVTLEGELGRSAVDPDTARSVNGAARQLRRTYGWSESLAVTFLLAGGVPIAPLVRVKVNGLGLLFDKQLPPTAGDAVVLTVHPDTPASEVAAAYSAAQARYWTRPRLLSSRMASAVTAAATLPTLAEANKSLGSGKKGQYRDTATFRGLVERARRRLVGLGEPVTVEAHEANLEASMEHSRRRTEELARL